MGLLELFCAVDDFWKAFEPTWRERRLGSGERQRERAGELSGSEMITIVIHFHQARYRDFKTYYTQYVQGRLPTRSSASSIRAVSRSSSFSIICAKKNASARA